VARRCSDIDGKRYIGDWNLMFVHDRLNDTCECGCVRCAIRVGYTTGFIPDTLEAALSLGFRPCPYCLGEWSHPWSSGSPGDSSWSPSPLLPRGPDLSPGGAVSMEAEAEAEAEDRAA
jgi:hypothetical protein